MKLAAALLAAGSLYAQAAFDSASIKPSKSLDGGASFSRSPGMMVIHNASLTDLIREAYGVGEAQIIWVERAREDRYDITARAPSGSRPEQRAEMMQALLAERFQLKLRRGNRELPVYALVVAKGGHKLKEVPAGSGGIATPGFEVIANAVTISRLVSFLSGPKLQLGHPVVDRTGLTGSYTFDLKWKPDELFNDLQEQLGLKLESSKGSVDVLLVDHFEKPTEN